jgi:hypothetical protein
MKQYKRIGHCKTFRPHEFVYEKIELSEDFPTDKPDEECFRELLERIEAMAKISYPWLFEQEEKLPNGIAKYSIPGYRMDVMKYPLTPNEVTNDNEQPPEQKPLLQLIQESKTIKELQGWKLLVQVEKDETKKRELLIAYDEMFEKLKGEKV